jgi:hypothetical protein
LYYVFFGIGFQVCSPEQEYACTKADYNVQRVFLGSTRPRSIRCR